MKKRKVKKITFVDLFAGIGGFHLGITQAAKKNGIGAECVLAVDINENARATYSGNFKSTPLLNDVTDQDVKASIPANVDIICGGFPCQPFSQAGKKRGVEDDRGTLFMHIAQIIREKTPKVIFLENVRNLKNIKNSDGTYVLDVIKEALKDAGYLIREPEIFRATDFGLPTHRPRIYLVGFRKDVFPDHEEFHWPKRTHDEPSTLAEYFKELDKEWNGLVARRGWPDSVGNTLRVGGLGSGFRDKEGRRVRDRRNWDSYMFHESQKNQIEHELSVHEAKAMMGFPAQFQFGDLSRHQALRQLGNSVAVPVIQAIAESILEVILYGRSNNKRTEIA